MDVLGDWPLNEVVGFVKAARATGKPIVFVGTGTERLERDKSLAILSSELAPNVLHWSVRSARDKARLVEYGVPARRVTEAADLAWTLEPVDQDFGRERLLELGLDLSRGIVGVNVNSESHMLAKAPALFEEIARGLDRILEDSPVSVVFLCNEVRDGESFDKATSERIMRRMRHANRAFLVPNRYWSPQEMLSFIACCSTTISTRYHFCLLSALQGVPFVALKRSDKVADLCWDLEWALGVSLEEVTSASLLEQFHAIAAGRAGLVRELAARTSQMRDRSLRNVVALDALRP